MADLRVLQVLADTDDVDDSRFALDLHTALTATGIQVRTMALGPGRRGGLESLVPVMSPSRRSIAAHTQLRREQRWADVVLLRGRSPASVAGLAQTGVGPPTVLALGEESRRYMDGPVPSRVRRLVDRGATVVVTDDSFVAVAHPLGVDPDAVAVIPVGVSVQTPPTTMSQRRVARDLLGLPANAALARSVRAGQRDDGSNVRRAAAQAGVAVVDDGAGDREVVAAAADIAVFADLHGSGPPRGLLLAGRDGAALVAPVSASPGLVDDDTGVNAGPDEETLVEALGLLASDPDRRSRCGASASARVRDRYDLDAVAGRWADLLLAAARVETQSGEA